jgi:hypothetical protein
VNGSFQVLKVGLPAGKEESQRSSSNPKKKKNPKDVQAIHEVDGHPNWPVQKVLPRGQISRSPRIKSNHPKL